MSSVLDGLVFEADPCTCDTVLPCGHCACDVCLECGQCSGGDKCVCPCRRTELEEARRGCVPRHSVGA